MDRKLATKLYQQHAPAMAHVAVSDSRGNQRNGTAFHVGDGVFLTARHVVENMSIVEIKPTEPLLLPPERVYHDVPAKMIEKWEKALGFRPYTRVPQEILNLTDGPYYHPNEEIDVAAFRVSGIDPDAPHVRLGLHLDDRILDHDWILTEAIVFGYPPIPMTTEPHLVVTRAEINAVVQFRHTQGVHFILSATPRGGFSGGLAVSELGGALGLVTQSMFNGVGPTETGFFSVTSVEPLYQCLASANILPKVQDQGWNGFWNDSSSSYTKDVSGGLQVASLTFHDDGAAVYIDCHAYQDGALVNEMVTSVLSAIGNRPTSIDRKRDDWARVNVTGDAQSAAELASIGYKAAQAMLSAKGLYRRR